jgi:hypothetical protein
MTTLWIQYRHISQPNGHCKITAAMSVTPLATIRLRVDDRAGDGIRTPAMKRCVVE